MGPQDRASRAPGGQHRFHRGRPSLRGVRGGGKGGQHSPYEDQLARQIDLEGLPTPERQHYFAKELRNERGHVRMFRFDFAWPDRQLAAEVDGGRFMVRRDAKGRVVPVGYHGSEKDYEKLNCAALLGWRVLRFSPDMVRKGKALRILKEVLMR